MICPKCKTTYEDGLDACPACGAQAGRSGKPGFRLPRSPVQRAVLIGAALLLAAVIGMICWKTAEASAAPTAGEMEETAVVCGGRSLTNTELNYYFWSEYFYLVNGYGENLPASLDPEKPLEEQAYDGERTWQDYVLEQTLATVRSTLTMVFEAEAAGFTLPEDYRRSLDEVLQNFRDYAETSGYVDAAGEPDVQAYLKASYGPGATVEFFAGYLEDSYLAAAYSDALFYGAEFTEQEIAEFYDLYAGEYAESGILRDDSRLRTIRAVVLRPASQQEADWEEARTSAETLYATWQAESGNEDDFAAMASAHSDDASGARGGLMEDLQPGDLSGDLGQWVFADGRCVGDTAVLRSDEGWVIVYYVGESDTAAWQQAAEADLRREAYQDAFRAAEDRYAFEVSGDRIRIATPDGLYDGAAGAAETLPSGN